MKGLRRASSKLLAGIAAAALAATVAGWFGSASEVAGAIQQAAPLWPILAYCALLPLWFMRREPAWRLPVAAGLIFALTTTALLARAFFPHLPAPDGSSRALRIVELNAWIDNRDPDVAARWIRGQNPDVVVLLEASGRAEPIARKLAPLLPYRTSCRLERPCSTLILSRIPPIERRGLAHGDADNRKALSAALVRFGAPWPNFGLLAIHLSQPWPLGTQRHEIEQLAAGMAGESRHRLVVAGDFNAMPWSSTFTRITTVLGVRSIGGEPASWPAPPAGMRVPTLFPIDHVLLGPGWAAARSVRGPAVGSDHYPFTVTLVAGGDDVGR